MLFSWSTSENESESNFTYGFISFDEWTEMRSQSYVLSSHPARKKRRFSLMNLWLLRKWLFFSESLTKVLDLSNWQERKKMSFGIFQLLFFCSSVDTFCNISATDMQQFAVWIPHNCGYRLVNIIVSFFR